MVDALMMKSLCSLKKKKKKLSCIFQLKVCFIHKNALQNTDPGHNPEDRCITWACDLNVYTCLRCSWFAILSINNTASEMKTPPDGFLFTCAFIALKCTINPVK